MSELLKTNPATFPAWHPTQMWLTEAREHGLDVSSCPAGGTSVQVLSDPDIALQIAENARVQKQAETEEYLKNKAAVRARLGFTVDPGVSADEVRDARKELSKLHNLWWISRCAEITGLVVDNSVQPCLVYISHQSFEHARALSPRSPMAEEKIKSGPGWSREFHQAALRAWHCPKDDFHPTPEEVKLFRDDDINIYVSDELCEWARKIFKHARNNAKLGDKERAISSWILVATELAAERNQLQRLLATAEKELEELKAAKATAPQDGSVQGRPTKRSRS